MVVLREDTRAPASQQSEHPGRQVTRRVDRVAAVVAKAESYAEDSEANTDGNQLSNKNTSYHETSQPEASITCLSSFMLRGSVMAQMQRSSNIVPRN